MVEHIFLQGQLRAWARLGVLLASLVSLHAARTPNILLILTDDQGWFDLGFNGNPHVETPVLDQLAREGVRFNHFYAAPVCTPTRAGLMTGRFYQRTGATDTFMGRDVLDASEITIASLFQRQGYRTGCFGKWHLGRYAKYHPNARGFDEFFGFWQYGFINRYMDSDELFQDRHPAKATGYITDVLTDAALSFLKRNRDKPFFLYIPYNAPHDPHLVPDPYIAKYLKKGLPLAEARVYGMITSLDENIGRLLKSLDELRLRENTVVIFMTDNGGVSRFYKCGLRGNKGSVHEGGVRVPLVVRWPGTFPAGAQIDFMAQYVDLFPTLCELIGAPIPNDRTIDGKSLLSALRSGRGTNAHEYICQEWSRVAPNPNANWMIRDSRYKLVNGELFDLQNDPGEQTNIVRENPDLAKRLRARFEEWFKDVTAGRTYPTRVPIEIGHPDENPVELDVTWARPSGAKIKPSYVRYIRDAIREWTEPGDYVQWDISVIQPGTYELTLEYGCPPGDEGSTFRVVAGDSHLDGKTRSTAGATVFRPETIGRLRIEKNVTAMELRPTHIANRQLMVLHKVWLRRI